MSSDYGSISFGPCVLPKIFCGVWSCWSSVSKWRVRCLRHDPHGLGTGFGVVWVVLTLSGRVIKGSKFPQGTPQVLDCIGRNGVLYAVYANRNL